MDDTPIKTPCDHLGICDRCGAEISADAFNSASELRGRVEALRKERDKLLFIISDGYLGLPDGSIELEGDAGWFWRDDDLGVKGCYPTIFEAWDAADSALRGEEGN